MDEYISRHEAIRAVQLSYGDYEATRKAIYEIPGADVAPVRHGRWVHCRYENCSEQFEIVKCSCCGHEAYAMAFYVRGGNYCPNCGARMDGAE